MKSKPIKRDKKKSKPVSSPKKEILKLQTTILKLKKKNLELQLENSKLRALIPANTNDLSNYSANGKPPKIVINKILDK